MESIFDMEEISFVNLDKSVLSGYFKILENGISFPFASFKFSFIIQVLSE